MRGSTPSTTERKPTRKSATSRSARLPRAMSMLKQDHQKVRRLFGELEHEDAVEARAELALIICKELSVHARLEEEVFYPAAREYMTETDPLTEAAIEHESIKSLVTKLEQALPGDEEFDALAKVLQEYVEHHVKEEESVIFPRMQRTDIDFDALHEEMIARKELLRADAGLGDEDDEKEPKSDTRP